MKKETPALTQPPADHQTGHAPGDGALAGDIANESPDVGAAPFERRDGETPSTPADRALPAPVPVERGRGALPTVLAVLALALAGGSAWQIWSLRATAADIREEVAQRLADGDVAVGEARALIRQQQESIAALQGKVGALESQAAASAGQAAALEQLYQEFNRTRNDQVLAEVEQAVNIAAQQLQLAGNVEAALVALQGAEARLALPELGHLQALRRALMKDIDDIKARPQVDVSGLALRLEILLERVDKLPLAYEVTLAEQAAAAEPEGLPAFDSAHPLDFIKAVAADVWDEMRSLVRLERLDQSDPVLLAPAQSTYLRENVKIRLLTARLALLARDGRTFSSDLSQARGWIEKFFDPRDAEVQRAVADLRELEQTPVKAEQFSLTESFAALRLLQARGPVRAGADAPPATQD